MEEVGWQLEVSLNGVVMRIERLVFLILIHLSSWAMLSGCGGQRPDELRPTVQYASPPVVSSNSITFNGYRANYLFSTASGNLAVIDQFGSDGEVKVASNVELLIFKDVSVNLTIPNLVKTLNDKDVTTIIELYIAYFKRVPDANGLAYWCKQFKEGMSLEQISESFYAAGLIYSSVTGYTAAMTNQEFVTLVYKNVLGRDNPDSEGLNYWTDSLIKGKETRGTLIRTMLASAHSFKGNATYGWVADLLDNKIIVARDFAITKGYSYVSDQDSITKGMIIAGAVTPTGYSQALSFIDILSGLKLPTLENGTFRDSIVQGVRYVATAPNGMVREGTTDESGRYQYFENGRIDFYVGNILIGRVTNPTATTVTAYLQSEPAATNIARFLQTIDQDNNPSNGIVIPAEVVSNAGKVNGLDFSSSNFESKFEEVRGTLLQNSSIPANRELVSSYDASEHAGIAGRLALNEGSRLVRALQGKLTYPSSYNIAALNASEFQRIRLYVWENEVRKGIDDKILVYSGRIQTTDGQREMVDGFLKSTNSLLELISIGTNLKTLAARGLSGVSTVRKLSFTVPMIEDIGVSTCNILAEVTESDGSTSPVDVDSDTVCNMYKSLHAAMKTSSEPNGLNESLLDTTLLIEKAALKTINKNRLLINMLGNSDLGKLEPVDAIKTEIKVIQAVNDFASASKVSADNQNLTNYLIARLYLDAWIKSAGDRSFLTKSIYSQTGTVSNTRVDDIAALVKFYGQTGIWCDVKTFFKSGFLVGIADIEEGKYSPGKFCEPNVDLVAINQIVDTYVAKMNENIKGYAKLIGPFANSSSIGVLDIPISQSNTATISTVVTVDTNANVLMGQTTPYGKLRIRGTTLRPLLSGEKVAIFDGENQIGTALVMSGEWSFSTGALTEGSHSFSATVLSLGGLSGAKSIPWTVTVKLVCQLGEIVVNGVCSSAGSDTTMFASYMNSYLVDSKNTLYVSGLVYKGFPTGESYSLKFIPVMNNVTSVQEGEALLIVTKDGQLFGRGVIRGASVEVVDEIKPLMTNVKYAVSGTYYVMVIKKDQTLWAIGQNYLGALGTGNYDAQFEYKQVLDSVRSVSANNSTLAIKGDSTLWATGSNGYGQLCSAPLERNWSSFRQIASNVAAIAQGDAHTLILKTDGSLYGCGDNRYGQLGLGSTLGASTMTKIMTDVAKISASGKFSFVIKTDGTLWATGENTGHFGTGDKLPRYYFSQVFSRVKQVSSTYIHTLIQLDDGSIWASGSNYYGAFGSGNAQSSTVFVKIDSPFSNVYGQPGEVVVSGGLKPQVIH